MISKIHVCDPKIPKIAPHTCMYTYVQYSRVLMYASTNTVKAGTYTKINTCFMLTPVTGNYPIQEKRKRYPDTTD